MNNLQRLRPARSLLNPAMSSSRTTPLAQSLCRQCLRSTLLINGRRRPSPALTLTQQRRAASSSSSSSSDRKPIVLEQPDKFRPPSHPARLGGRRRPQQGAYNQGTTADEKERQKTRTYPHMFPNEGTFMHWFLTDRWIHIWITMGTLTVLAVISLTQTFLQTSPYAHLLPPLSSLPLHPITWVRETLSVVRLHIDYTTQQTAESRQRAILDAQKRRLYRRAHGMEDLDKAEDQGIDVRGLVPWDDGLTKAEREAGGRRVEVITGQDVVAMGGAVGEDLDEFARRMKAQRAEAEAAAMSRSSQQQQQQQQEEGQQGAEESQPQQKRKRKLWLGIW